MLKTKLKSRIVILIVGIVTLGAAAAVFYWPVKTRSNFEGIMYVAGDSSFSEKVEVKIDGETERRLFTGDRFKGTISIGAHVSPVSMKYDGGYFAVLNSDENSKEGSWADFRSKDLTKEVTVLVLEDNENGKGWSYEGGLTVSAPADNRDEAVSISNRLLGLSADKSIK